MKRVMPFGLILILLLGLPSFAIAQTQNNESPSTSTTESNYNPVAPTLSKFTKFHYFSLTLNTGFNEFFKGGQLGFDWFTVLGNKGQWGINWYGGLNTTWTPKFQLNDCSVGVGPCYCTHITESTNFYLAGLLMLSCDGDFKNRHFYARISPKFRTRFFTYGLFADFSSTISFGLTIGLAFNMSSSII